MKNFSKLLLMFSLFCGFSAAHHIFAQPQPIIDGFTGVSGFSGIAGTTGMYQAGSEINSDGCEGETQSCTCSNTRQRGICDTGPIKEGLYCQCGEEQDQSDVAGGRIMPETNGVTVHHFQSADNFQKVMNYFAPYLSVLALNFAASLVHEIGHNVVDLAVNKQWSKIWIGEHGVTQLSFDQDPRLDIEKWNSYLKGRDLRDALVIIPNNSQEKWELHLLNGDSLFNNDWISIYMPNEELWFQAFIRSNGIANKYLAATKDLMGPAFGALFSWFMLQNVRQPNLECAAKYNLFINLVVNLFRRSTDGENALKALNVPTDWMKAVEQEEYPLAQSAFYLINPEHVVDIRMFSKALQSKTEAHRMITLMGQAAFKILIPLAMNYLKEGSNNIIDATKKYLSEVEQEYFIRDKGSPGFYLVKILMPVLLPAMVIYGIVAQNANTPVVQHLTKYF